MDGRIGKKMVRMVVQESQMLHYMVRGTKAIKSFGFLLYFCRRICPSTER